MDMALLMDSSSCFELSGAYMHLNHCKISSLPIKAVRAKNAVTIWNTPSFSVAQENSFRQADNVSLHQTAAVWQKEKVSPAK